MFSHLWFLDSDIFQFEIYSVCWSNTIDQMIPHLWFLDSDIFQSEIYNRRWFYPKGKAQYN